MRSKVTGAFVRYARRLCLLALTAYTLLVPQSAHAQRNVQLTPDATLRLVSKDVGNERWAITLDVATRLRDLLQKYGFEVVVTRSDDRLIALRDRAHIANTSWVPAPRAYALRPG